MRIRRIPTRTAAVVAAAGLAAAVASPAAASPSEAWQPFSATAGEGCFAGWSEGRLAWRETRPPQAPAVEAVGRVAGGAEPSDTPYPCPAVVDPRAAAVAFTAYSGDTVVDTAERRTAAGGAPLDFTVVLDPGPWSGAPSPSARIDRVDVQVCLLNDPSERPGTMFPDECGEPRTYRP